MSNKCQLTKFLLFLLLALHSQLLWCKVYSPKSQENRTNMDIILFFLAEPLDKHGVTLVHITYQWAYHLSALWNIHDTKSAIIQDKNVTSTTRRGRNSSGL